MKRRKVLYMLSVINIFAVLVSAAFFASKDVVTNRFVTSNISTLLTETKWVPSNAVNIEPNSVLPKNPQVTNTGDVDVYTFLEVKVPYFYMENLYIEKAYGDIADLGKSLTVSDGAIEYDPDSNKNITYTKKVPLFRFIVDGVTNESKLNEPKILSSLEQDVKNSWKMVGEPTDDGNGTFTYVYAYTDENGALKRLPPKGENTTNALFDAVKLVNIRENETSPMLDEVFANRPLAIDISSHSIQADHLALENTQLAEVWALANNG